MSFEVDTAYVNAYHSNVEIMFQQRGSRLRETVMVESQNSEYDYYDRIGEVAAEEVTNRHGDTPLISTPHTRRRVATRDFDWADLIDKRDKIRMLADPTASYTRNAVYALGRSLDEVIIEAATGTAYAGKNGQTAVTFPTATQQIAVDYNDVGADVNSNLTIGKLRYAQFLFQSNEAVDDESDETMWGIVTASQLQSLLQTTEVTSADYNTVKALVDGKVNSFMGFKFKRTQLLSKSGNNRSCLFYPQSAIQVGMADDINTDVGPRRDKRNSIQVYAAGSFGATRMWEEKVVEILCDESV